MLLWVRTYYNTMNTSFLLTAGSVERRPITCEALIFFFIIRADLVGFLKTSLTVKMMQVLFSLWTDGFIVFATNEKSKPLFSQCFQLWLFFFQQRLTDISEAARCPTTGGMFGSLNSGRKTSTVSWGCMVNDPVAWRNAQVRLCSHGLSFIFSCHC